MPAEALLTPRAARRVAREGASQSFDQAALALNEDWGTHLDGKQIQRWSESLGQSVVLARDAEVRAYEQGHRPLSPPNPPALLVIGMDGGRVQTREKQGGNGSRWREDKVCAITSYLPGDGTPEHPRRVLANNVGYFQAHRHQMHYPTYRAKGWPIGSGVTESAVKLFNKRVKGTEQFWNPPGVESILGLRALRLSQDGRWERYWDSRPAYRGAA